MQGWDPKKVIGVAVLVGALSQIGNGLKAVSWLVGVPDAAYGGQATAQKVDEEFKEYLNAQKASTEAIKGYIAAQQQANAPQPLPEPRTPPRGHPSTNAGYPTDESGGEVNVMHPEDGSINILRRTDELSDDGEVRLMRWTDEHGKVRTMCCNGTDCWPWHKQTQCAR